MTPKSTLLNHSPNWVAGLFSFPLEEMESILRKCMKKQKFPLDAPNIPSKGNSDYH